MIAVLKRWGNSLGLRINKPLIDQLKLKENSEVIITVKDDTLIVKPKRRLEDLLSRITPENMHNENEWLNEKPVGNEVW